MLTCRNLLKLQSSVFLLSTSRRKDGGKWLLGRACQQLQRGSCSKCLLHCQAAGREEPDVAVFGFTLGIPGFDDALIPRFVGVLGLLLLLVNHILNQSAYAVGQVRAEVLGAALAALCILTPTIETRLREVAPGRGRKAASGELDGAVQIFKLDPSLPDAVKQELAWASYALLRNTNTAGLLVLTNRRVVVARGALGSSVSPSGASPTLDELGQTVHRWHDALQAEIQPSESSAYLPDRAALGRVGAKSWAFLPTAASSLLVQRLEDAFSESRDEEGVNGSGKASGGLLVMWSDEPRALSQQERRWAAAVTSKLADFLEH